MRNLRIHPDLARDLGRLRASRGHDGSPVRVRLQDLERIEREFSITLPDPVVAYVAAGVSLWGDGPLSLGAIRERTLSVRELIEEMQPGDLPADRRFVVIDDDSNGNYIAVAAGTGRRSDAVVFLDHEEGYQLGAPQLGILEQLARALEGVEGEAPRFAIDLYDEPDAEPGVVWVTHAKFGRGKVLSEVDDTVTVEFESAGEKRLKRRFLTFDG